MKDITCKDTAQNHRIKDHRRCGRFTGLAAAATLALTGPSAAFAQTTGPWSFNANIGAVSNYMWRGTSQTSDKAAVQGGLDMAHDSGFYAGTWASNLDWGYDGSPNYELDLYMGFDFSLPDENASLGLNTIYYAYPDSDDKVDFWEIGISAGYSFFSAGIQYTAWGGNANKGGPFSEGDLYYNAALDFPLPHDFSLSIFGGYYDFRDDAMPVAFNRRTRRVVTRSADYGHWGVSISKEAGDFGTFSFTYEQNDGYTNSSNNPLAWGGYDNDPKFWVGWTKEF